MGASAIPFIKERVPIVQRRSAEYERAAPVSWSFLRKSAFYAFLLGGFVFSLGVTLPGIYIPSYAVDLGLSKTMASALVTIMNGKDEEGNLNVDTLVNGLIWSLSFVYLRQAWHRHAQ